MDFSRHHRHCNAIGVRRTSQRHQHVHAWAHPPPLFGLIPRAVMRWTKYCAQCHISQTRHVIHTSVAQCMCYTHQLQNVCHAHVSHTMYAMNLASKWDSGCTTWTHVISARAVWRWSRNKGTWNVQEPLRKLQYMCDQFFTTRWQFSAQSYHPLNW